MAVNVETESLHSATFPVDNDDTLTTIPTLFTMDNEDTLTVPTSSTMDNLTIPGDRGRAFSLPNAREMEMNRLFVSSDPDHHSINHEPMSLQVPTLHEPDSRRSSTTGSFLTTTDISTDPSESRRVGFLGSLSGSEKSRSFFESISRPISVISSVIKSTFSNIVKPNRRNRVQSILSRLTRRKYSNENTTDSMSTMIDPDISLCSQSGIKKKLDSLAGSEDSDLDLSSRRRSRKRFIRWLRHKVARMRLKPTCNYYIDPHGDVFFYWMGLVCLSLVYNAASIPLRVSFNAYSEHPGLWLTLDYLFADLVYILDMVMVKTHLSFRTNGILESNVKLLRKKYFMSLNFLIDIFSLLPLDILYAIPVLRFNALLRLPRLCKVRCLIIFQDQFESRTKHPHIFRVAKLVFYFTYIIHLYTCLYFIVSKFEGLGSNEWVYDGMGLRYLRCFYWALLTVSTIHELEENNPSTNLEFAVEMIGYLFGVFVLAVIIGEIRNIVEGFSGQKLATRRKLQLLKDYMKLQKLPLELQMRVQAWYDYAITQQLNLDENKVLNSLPDKMKADLAIHVHLDTLSKVSLFKDCEKTLLRELVLKLRPVLYVPGDYICKKGEIGKEMYIVNQGQVQVLGGPSNTNQVLAELGPGSVFGEISLLAVGGGNRRTAHVRSKGFSSLFVLSKKDLHETLVDYPDTQEMLKRKAKFLLKKDKKREKHHKQLIKHTRSELTGYKDQVIKSALASREKADIIRRLSVKPTPGMSQDASPDSRVYPNGSKQIADVEVHVLTDHSSESITAEPFINRFARSDYSRKSTPGGSEVSGGTYSRRSTTRGSESFISDTYSRKSTPF